MFSNILDITPAKSVLMFSKWSRGQTCIVCFEVPKRVQTVKLVVCLGVLKRLPDVRQSISTYIFCIFCIFIGFNCTALCCDVCDMKGVFSNNKYYYYYILIVLQLKCCGAVGPSDWIKTPVSPGETLTSVPDSCCITESPDCGKTGSILAALGVNIYSKVLIQNMRHCMVRYQGLW